jgi:hypothetical protein
MDEPHARLDDIRVLTSVAVRPEPHLADKESGKRMRKALTFLGATIGGYAGWYIGAPIGFMTAFMLSMIGTGLGIYAGIRATQNLE